MLTGIITFLVLRDVQLSGLFLIVSMGCDVGIVYYITEAIIRCH